MEGKKSESNSSPFHAPPCPLHLRTLAESYQDVSLLLSAAAGTMHFQSFFSRAANTWNNRRNEIWWEAEWQCLNAVFSSGTHCDFLSWDLSVPNVFQDTGLVHTEWHSGVGLKVTLSKEGKWWNIILISNVIWLSNHKMGSAATVTSVTHFTLETLHCLRRQR